MGKLLDDTAKSRGNEILVGLTSHLEDYERAVSYWISFKKKVETELRSEGFYVYSDNGVRDSFTVNMFGHYFKMFFIFKPKGSRICHTKKTGTQYNPVWKDFGRMIFRNNDGGIKDEKDVNISSLEAVLVHLKLLKDELEIDVPNGVTSH